MPKYAILRFEKHKGHPAAPLEAHHERQKEKYPDLERGESASMTGRKHIPTRLFKQAVHLSKQAIRIEKLLDEMNPFNSGRKKEELLVLLKKWFPQMENFSTQLKKYQITIDDLLEENSKLEARAKAGESGKMKDALERKKLKSELHSMKQIMSRIPPEVMEALRQDARHQAKDR